MGIVNNTKARSIINEISKRNPSKFKVANEIPGRGKPGTDTSISHVTPEYNKEPGSPAKVAPVAAAAAGGAGAAGAGAGGAGAAGGGMMGMGSMMGKGGGFKLPKIETYLATDIDTAGGPKRRSPGKKRVPSTYDAQAATNSLDYRGQR